MIILHSNWSKLNRENRNTSLNQTLLKIQIKSIKDLQKHSTKVLERMPSHVIYLNLFKFEKNIFFLT